MKHPPVQATVFYDNECGLCLGFVRWIEAHDRRSVFNFSALQDSQSSCPVELDSDPRLWSVVLVDNAGVWQSSEAVLRILCGLGGIYRLFIILRLAPQKLRDSIYRFIARHRASTNSNY